MASYYRQFVPNFAATAAPLYTLTKKEPKGVEWTDDCEWAFQNLKDTLTTAPILIFPNFNKEFTIETDASKHGLGAILSQDTTEGRKPVAYASRVCNSAEANYSATELECLGVIFGIQQFRCYILGRQWTLITDHQALKNLKMMKNPSGRRARWIMTLMEYSPYTIEYRKGKLNGAADAISRLFPQTNNDPTTTDEAMITAVTRAQAERSSIKKQPEKLTEQQAQQQAADLTVMSPANNTEYADFISLEPPEIVQEATKARGRESCAENDQLKEEYRTLSRTLIRQVINTLTDEAAHGTTKTQECKLCGKNDHRTRDCHIKILAEKTLQEIAETQECKCCGENGHWTRNCRVKALVENMKKKQCRNGPLCRLHEQGLCIFDHSSNKASYQCRYGSECRYLAEGNCAPWAAS